MCAGTGRSTRSALIRSRVASADAVSFSLQEQLTYGLPADYWNTYAERARAITSEQTAAVARKLIDPAKVVWVVVGDSAKIEAGVKQLGLGEIRYLDGDGRPLKVVP